MSMLKEADFVRYGSTRRVGNLRKREQEILWEGVVDRESLSGSLLVSVGESLCKLGVLAKRALYWWERFEAKDNDWCGLSLEF